MTKGRKPGPAVKAAPVALDEAAMHRDLAQAQEAEDQRREILQDAEARRTDETIRLGMQMGALRFAQIQTNILRAAQIHLFDEIRKSKAYRDLPIKHPDGKVRAAQNIEEFCAVYLGMSYRKAHEESQLLASLGDSAFETAKQLGLKRDLLRQIPGLPVDTQDSVKELINSGAAAPDIASAVESLVTRFAEARVKDEAEKQRLQKDLIAKDGVIRNKEAKISELEEEIERRAVGPTEQEESKQIELIRSEVLKTEAVLQQFRRAAKQVITQPATPAAETTARQAVEYLAQLLADIIDQLHVDVDLQELVKPTWLTVPTKP